MRANCNAIIRSIYICSFSLVLIIFFSFFSIQYDFYKIYEIILNIMIGIFGSGFVTLLIYVSAYNDSKRKLLEKYYQIFNNKILLFYNINYLSIDYDNDIFISYIKEIKNKKTKKELGIPINDNDYLEQLSNNFLKENPDFSVNISPELVKSYAVEYIKNDIEKIRKKIKDICVGYIDLAKINTDDLDDLLGDMKFFDGNEHYEKIYKSTYSPLKKIISLLKDEKIHLQLFLDGEGAEWVVFERILQLQKEIFMVKNKENDGYIFTSVYNKFADKMFNNAEALRASIYGEKPVKQKSYPIYSKTKNTNVEKITK